MIMRPAGPDDVDIVFELANDPEVRKSSFSSGLIPYSTHVAWYADQILRSSDVFLLFFEDKAFIGQIRFSLIREAFYRISISLKASFRGQGIAETMLANAITYLCEREKRFVISAQVKKTNIASCRFFERAGFVLNDSVVVNGEQANEYTLSVDGGNHE